MMPKPLYFGTTRWLVTLTVILVAIVEVLDITIVNVSLPNMMGTLGANSEQITWVLTSYIVSAAIFMPLTGFFIERFGQKRLLLINIAGFLAASILCGISSSLTEMVLFRTCQGIFGASLVPLSQLILRDAFPLEEQGKAMAIWGVGIMVAPVLGPTLGGYITEALNWRWVFFINIPVCILSFFLAWYLLIETPTRIQKIDWLGASLMAVGIASLQIFLDRGNQEGWLTSHFILVLLFIWIFTLTFFIVRGLNNSNNIINLNLFKDANFSSGCLLITLYCVILFGVIAAQPVLTESYMGYSAGMTGLIMASRGVCSAIAMMAVAGLIKRIDPRILVLLGVIFTAIGTWMMSGFTLTSSFYYMSLAGAWQGLGMGLFFVPLSVITFNTLSPENVPVAAGLFSFGRSLGSSIGISIITTLLARETQINWNRLGGHINIFNPNLQAWLLKRNWTLTNPLAIHSLVSQLGSQAAMIGFVDIFWAGTLGVILMIPLVFIMKRPERDVALGAGH